MPHSTNFLEGNFAERKPQLLYTADLPRGLRLIPEFHRHLTRHKVQSGKREEGKGKKRVSRLGSAALPQAFRSAGGGTTIRARWDENWPREMSNKFTPQDL